ncbi:MAG: hypothetical protein F6K22_22140 [Okeania sp. SIO2F4]|uniref:hypothetical protein n=1 Tax=Okeania sp. SIO2F4 TaxID=2607790 RepID=UPI00142C346D|nr:hypothetical protein [Okeania sp. SIO2F4]NES05281.1 hypothetical protein [Okeania sp. SIO2F4]
MNLIIATYAWGRKNSTTHPHPACASENESIIATYAWGRKIFTTHPHPACASENELIIATYAWGRKIALSITSGGVLQSSSRHLR